MSVMTRSHDPSPSPSINSSADANPRAPYPNEQRDSTSAIRKDSSSSMTAIDSSPDTHHPFIPDYPLSRIFLRGLEWRVSHVAGEARNYTRVLSGDVVADFPAGLRLAVVPCSGAVEKLYTGIIRRFNAGFANPWA